MEKWDKKALADYITTLIMEIPVDCVEADISWSRNSVYLECKGDDDD